MKAKILSLFLLVTIAFSYSVSADLKINDLEFDAETFSLVISGNTGNEYAEGVLVTILPDGADKSALFIDEDTLVDYTLSDDNGDFIYNVILNENFDTGKYMAYVDTEDYSSSVPFMIFNRIKANFVLGFINKASSPAEVATILRGEYTYNNSGVQTTVNPSDLGVELDSSSSGYEVYVSYISNVIYASKPSAGYDIASFTKQYNIAYAMVELKNGTSLDDVMKNYGALIGIDVNEYNNLETDVKTELESLIKSETGYEGDVMNYAENLILAKLNTAGGYEEHGKIFMEYADAIGISLDKYNEIQNDYYTDKVLIDIYAADYENFEQAVKIWNVAVDVRYDEWVKSQSGGGSGGGGGGAGGGSTVNPDVNFVVGDDVSVSDNGEVNITDNNKNYFKDTENHWACKSISNMYERGIVNGYGDGTFRPDSTVTRAEFVKMITNAVKLATTDIAGIGFSDVSDTAWYANCVKLAYANNIVQGHNGMFRPLDNILRQDAAIIIYKTIVGCGIKIDGVKNFGDEADISDYAKTYVLSMAANGIVNGSDGRFYPLNTLTRAEAVKLIENMLAYMGK